MLKYIKDVMFTGPALHQAYLLVSHPVGSIIAINAVMLGLAAYAAYHAYNAGKETGRKEQYAEDAREAYKTTDKEA